MSGPISLESREGSSTRTALTACSSSSRKRSKTLRSTRMRERAQQSWPALSKRAHRRAGSRSLDVGIGKDDVGALAAELQGDPLDLFRAAGHYALADLGRPRESHLADVGMSNEPLAHDGSLARQDGEDVLGQPGLERQLCKPERC